MPTPQPAAAPAPPLLHDRDTLPELLAAVVEESSHFLATLPRRRAGAKQPFDEVLPPGHYRPGFVRGVVHPNDTEFGEGRGALATLRHCVRRFDDLIVASSGPRYLGYVVGGVTPAALAGDWLASVYDQNPQGLRWFGDASGRIEYETIGLLRDTLGLPADFNGGFVTGATMSNFTCLATARQWLGDRLGRDVASNGFGNAELRVYAATPHSSTVKALRMLGFGSAALRLVKTLPDREAMDVADLEQQLAAEPGTPAIVVGSAGTVNTADFDDFRALHALRDRFDFWLHIDGAFGGFAALLPKAADYLDHWQYADSITVDNHKWLNVPYDSGTWFVRKKHEALQVATFRNGDAPYLGDNSEFNYLNLGPENSRRLRALPVWSTLRAYGKAGYRDIVTRCVAAARELGDFVQEEDGFELLAPVRLNVVSFTLTDADPATVTRFLQQLNDNGRYFLTPTTLNGRPGMRAAFVNWRTEPRDVHWLRAELRNVLGQVRPPAPAPRRTPPTSPLH
ncbi:pyridoxal phosphate-dependent decarboxylase family protein [Lewinella sp. IMCC34183]|uniref:pyridoxal phosphate-dependent decarboxylase family protein n=1 Tax=Lewinella sp. IMCC34183 TaxID=2248762 RepID=UPI000E2264F6|nr:pyridoxal-dependent decarboxylase [Lewinella sp. IMCC34183]